MSTLLNTTTPPFKLQQLNMNSINNNNVYNNNNNNNNSISTGPSNLYLNTLIEPFRGSLTGIPDFNMTPSVLKTVTLSSLYTVPTGISNISLLFVVPFNSPRRAVRVFAMDPSLGKYNWLMDISQDEDLAQSFDLLRLVSGGFKIESSTTTGNNFTVSGAVNAISYQALPPLSTLTYENVASYKRGNSTAVLAVPVATGAIALAEPTQSYDYFVPEDPQVISSVNESQVTINSVSDSWVVNAANNVNLTATTSSNLFPTNATGIVDISASISCIAGLSVGATTTMTATINYTVASSSTFATSVIDRKSVV